MGDGLYINKIEFTHSENYRIKDIINNKFEFEICMKQELIDKHFKIYKTIIAFKSKTLKFIESLTSIKDILINIKSVNINDFIFEENHLYNGKIIYNNRKTNGNIHEYVLLNEYQKILNILGGVTNENRRMRRINRKTIECDKKNFSDYGERKLQFIQTSLSNRIYAEAK